MNVYLDNAATTPLDKKVIDEMVYVMKNNFGNPSSVHSYGRESRVVIEQARKKVSSYINASPSEIFFTSGGTESNNTVLRRALNSLGVTCIITSPIEHHAVIDTAKSITATYQTKIELVKVLANGDIDIDHLKDLLKKNSEETVLVSLMHANNEIGNLLPLKKVADLCKTNNAYFHSDTVQTIGHYNLDVRSLDIDFLTCSAHKFHGPKGIGFLFINENIKLTPFITGGAQERNMRAGTENIYGIVGLAKAMEIAYDNLDEHCKYILSLKNYMIEELEKNISGVAFNGNPKTNSLYTVLNVLFPNSSLDEMLIYNLDIRGIAASGGSACSSGSNNLSHVLSAINSKATKPSIRFSFSKFNTKADIDYTIKVLKELFE